MLPKVPMVRILRDNGNETFSKLEAVVQQLRYRTSQWHRQNDARQ